MSHVFDTIAQATEAGYEQPSAATLETYQGYEIRIRDMSGTSAFGYSFAIVAVPTVASIRAGRRPLGPFGATVDVSLTQESNKLGQIGAVMAMFPPGELSRAIAKAKAKIDAVE